MRAFSLDGGFGMNPLASRLSKVQHSFCDWTRLQHLRFHLKHLAPSRRSQEVPTFSLPDDGVAGNSVVLGRLFSENPVSSVPSDTVSKSNERLEPSSSGSGAAVDV